MDNFYQENNALFTKENVILDRRRRKLLFRAWHRGIREIDLLLGPYVNAYIAQLTNAELDDLEYIMSFEDRDLLQWFMGEKPITVPLNKKLFSSILSYSLNK